ncbi:MAG: hypothetical protein ABSE06_20140 [Anaerolineaceae bacterium]
MSSLLVIAILWTFAVATRQVIAKQESVKTRQAVLLPARVERFSRRHSL